MQLFCCLFSYPCSEQPFSAPFSFTVPHHVPVCLHPRFADPSGTDRTAALSFSSPGVDDRLPHMSLRALPPDLSPAPSPSPFWASTGRSASGATGRDLRLHGLQVVKAGPDLPPGAEGTPRPLPAPGVTVAFHAWPRGQSHQTFRLLLGETFSGLRAPFLSGCH